jgi:hypothetical protein
MSDFDLQHPKTDAQLGAVEFDWKTKVVNRLKEFEKRLAALESEKK